MTDQRAHVVVEDAVESHVLEAQIAPRLRKLRLPVGSQGERRMAAAHAPLPGLMQRPARGGEVGREERWIRHLGSMRYRPAAVTDEGTRPGMRQTDWFLKTSPNGAGDEVEVVIMGAACRNFSIEFRHRMPREDKIYIDRRCPNSHGMIDYIHVRGGGVEPTASSSKDKPHDRHRLAASSARRRQTSGSRSSDSSIAGRAGRTGHGGQF